MRIDNHTTKGISSLWLMILLLFPSEMMVGQPEMMVSDEMRIFGTEPKLFLGANASFGYTSIRWKSNVVRWDLFGYPLTIHGEVSVGRPGSGNVLLTFNSDRPWRFIQFGSGANTALKLQCNPTNNNKNFIIDTEGTVGINDDNPIYKLELPNNSANEGGQARAFDWDTYSDARVKKQVMPIQYGLQQIMALQPVSYNHHSADFVNEELILDLREFQPELGFIAQEVHKIMPEITYRPTDEKSDLWALSYTRLIPVLTKGMQEQQQEIDQLKATNKLLHNKIDELSEVVRSLIK